MLNEGELPEFAFVPRKKEKRVSALSRKGEGKFFCLATVL